MALFSRGNTPSKPADKQGEQESGSSSRGSEESDTVSFFGRLRLGSRPSTSPTRPLPGQIRRETGAGRHSDGARQDGYLWKSNSEGVKTEAQSPENSASQTRPEDGGSIRIEQPGKEASSNGSKQRPGFMSGLLGGLSFTRDSGGSSDKSSSSVNAKKSMNQGRTSEEQIRNSGSSDSVSTSDYSGSESPGKKSYRETQFDEVISMDTVDLTKLRALCWSGIPPYYRALSWQLMLGYLPSNRSRREAAIVKKRKEYRESVTLYFDDADVVAGAGVYGKKGEGRETIRESELGGQGRTQEELALHRQILVDLPRTTPELPFFHHVPIQEIMERVLYIWSMRHPASGYVQGMNDLLTPLLLVAAQSYIANDTADASLEGGVGTGVGGAGAGLVSQQENVRYNSVMSNGAIPRHHYKITATTDVLRFDLKNLSKAALADIEADTFWMFSKLLDNVQDHYTFSQPGLQRMVLRLEDVVRRHCPELSAHLQEEGIMFMQFAFRWMNCILLRELPLRCVLRLWDTYFAEERNGFENFHVYVCVVLLKMNEESLMTMNFQEIILFLQDLPTGSWTDSDIDPILSQAFILSTLYDQSTHV